MSVHAGQMLSHYRLVEKLGEGGMGVVWKAVDTSLDREVAIKVLREEAAADPQRVARLQREAKVVAGLSHPNIVTVHAVDESEGVRFVAMEIVHGRTLTKLIPRNGLPLDRFFELAIPLADAVAAAHRRGITHRDLKPGNVMVSDDGRLKVLDFGLAKLRESPGADPSEDSTSTKTLTREGAMLGTVPYMSPEQAEGKEVDLRSDLFSLGVVLYEMATGRRPFRGETPTAMVSSILKDDPVSVTELRPALPHHLGRIIRRCLRKDAERRYQTAQDLRNELEELRAEVGGGERDAVEGAGRRRPRSGWTWAVGLAAGALALASIVLVGRHGLWPGAGSRQAAPTEVDIVPLTHSGNVPQAALSPDGRYALYVPVDAGRSSLRVRQLATGSERELLPPQTSAIFTPEVSPDLEWVYYGQESAPPRGTFTPPGAHPSAVYRMPFLGGRPRRILEDVDGDFALSPDGRRIAFGRLEGARRLVMSAAVDGSDERKLVADRFGTSRAISWSADGKRVIFASPRGEGDIGNVLAEVAREGGPLTPLGGGRWAGVWSIAPWAGGDLLVSGNHGANSFQLPAQIWRLARSGSSLERLTHDVASYDSLSIDAAGDTLAAVQLREQHSVWILPGSDQAGARRVSFTSQSGPQWAGVTWLPDGRLVYEDLDGEELHLWAARPDGSDKERLTTAGTFNMGASVSPDGQTLAYFSDRDGGFRIWLSNVDGSDARPLTEGTQQELFPRFSPDGRWIVYQVAGDGAIHAMKVPVSGGSPTRLANGFSPFPVVSPDGRRVAYAGLDPADGRLKITVADFETGEVEQRIEHEFASLAFVRWTPDGRGLAAVSVSGGVGNIVVHPLDGGPPRQLTHFTDGMLFGFDWSRDGRDLAVVNSRRSQDVVLITVSGLRRG